MPVRKQFVVNGLGRFGRAVARSLTALGHEVVGIETDAALLALHQA